MQTANFSLVRGDDQDVGMIIKNPDNTPWGIVLDQIDFFETNDAFSIYAALQLEAIGFAIKGKGWKLAADNSIGLKGKIPFPLMETICIH